MKKSIKLHGEPIRGETNKLDNSSSFNNFDLRAFPRYEGIKKSRNLGVFRNSLISATEVGKLLFNAAVARDWFLLLIM